MSKEFRFKYFSVQQSHSALKVGTDAMVLGASIRATHPKTVLDIGTGTGVLALMMAQKYPNAHLTAIDNDPESLKDCNCNVIASDWGARFDVVQADVFDYTPSHLFDLIVCNPPYYEDALLPEETRTANAKHTHRFSLEQLFEKVKAWLKPKGGCWMILPSATFPKWETYTQSIGLHVQIQIDVHGKPGQSLRTIACFALQQVECPITEVLVIRNSDNTYTDQYKLLTADFHDRSL